MALIAKNRGDPPYMGDKTAKNQLFLVEIGQVELFEIFELFEPLEKWLDQIDHFTQQRVGLGHID